MAWPRGVPRSDFLGPVDLGEIVYEIEADGERWSGVGHPVKKEPRMGFSPPGSPAEWFHLNVTVKKGDSTIPDAGLTVRVSPKDCIGELGSWRVVSRHPAGNLIVLNLSTK